MFVETRDRMFPVDSQMADRWGRRQSRGDGTPASGGTRYQYVTQAPPLPLAPCISFPLCTNAGSALVLHVTGVLKNFHWGPQFVSPLGGVVTCRRMLTFSQQLCHLHSSIAVEP